MKQEVMSRLTAKIVATLKLQQRNVLDYLAEACAAANGGRPAPSLIPP